MKTVTNALCILPLNNAQLAKFNELAACYEFVDGMPRRLAEKKARAELNELAEATISAPPRALARADRIENRNGNASRAAVASFVHAAKAL